MLRGRGENAAHVHAVILQAANEIERFVGGNAAADDEENAWAFDDRDARSLQCRLRRPLLAEAEACGPVVAPVIRPADWTD